MASRLLSTCYERLGQCMRGRRRYIGERFPVVVPRISEGNLVRGHFRSARRYPRRFERNKHTRRKYTQVAETVQGSDVDYPPIFRGSRRALSAPAAGAKPLDRHTWGARTSHVLRHSPLP